MANNNELEVELKIGLSDEDKQKMADEIYDKVNDETQKELDEMHETIQSFGQLRPAGTDTSTNILNFKQDKGVYVANDTGGWYYWNGSAYVYGGNFQSDINAVDLGEIIPESTIEETMKKIHIKIEEYTGIQNSDNSQKVYMILLADTNGSYGTCFIIRDIWTGDCYITYFQQDDIKKYRTGYTTDDDRLSCEEIFLSNIADKSVTPEKTSFINVQPSPNIIKMQDFPETTKNGVTYSLVDNVLTINGTPTDSTQLWDRALVIPAGTRVTAFPNQEIQGWVFQIHQNWGNYIQLDKSNLTTYLTEDRNYTSPSVFVGQTFNNLKVCFMFTEGEDIPTQFVPLGTKYELNTSLKDNSVTIENVDFTTLKTENNLFMYYAPDKTENGITWSVKDGVITLNGYCTKSFNIFDAVVHLIKPMDSGYVRFFSNQTLPEGITYNAHKNWSDSKVITQGVKYVHFSTARTHHILYIAAGVRLIDFKFMPMWTDELPKDYFEPTNNIELDDNLFKWKVEKQITDRNKYSNPNIPLISLTGDIADMTKEVEVTLNYIYGDKSGTCTLKWQGSGSLQYIKKNYTIKFDNTFEAKAGWGEQKKYVLKANWIDPTHTRNLLGCSVWADIRKTRDNLPANLVSSPNYGAVDGFPVWLKINGEDMGLYTFNIPKDKWLFNMGTISTEAIVNANDWGETTAWREPPIIDDEKFELEYAGDDDLERVQTSFTNCYNSLNSATKDNYQTTLVPYLDIESVIDSFIFSALTFNHDRQKNYIMVTYDGTKWYMSEYDLDSIFGVNWDGYTFIETRTKTFSWISNWHKTFSWVYHNLRDQVKVRYLEIRNDIMNEDQFLNKYSNMLSAYPRTAYDKDNELWVTKPGTSSNTPEQIREWYLRRLVVLDKEVESW